MPKMKTNRSAAKRFERTGSGKLRRPRAHRAHYNIHKGSRRLRRLKGTAIVAHGEARTVRRLIAS